MPLLNYYSREYRLENPPLLATKFGGFFNRDSRAVSLTVSRPNANQLVNYLNLPPESDGSITALTFCFPASLINFFFQGFNLIVLQ